MENLEKLHYINIDKKNTSKSLSEEYTTSKDIDDLFQYLHQDNTEKLIIYFHGGLVSKKSGLSSANVMKNIFTDKVSKRHTISFIWETSLLEIVAQNFKNIANGIDYQEILEKSLRFLEKKLSIPSFINIKEQSFKTQSFNKLQELSESFGNFPEMGEVIAFNQYLPHSEEDLLPEVEAFLQENQSNQMESLSLGLDLIKNMVKVAFAVLQRYINQTHHDFYPTVVEEVFRKIYVDKAGGWIWSQIKNKAEEMFKDNTSLQDEKLHIGTYFLIKLNTHIQERKNQNKKFEIELIGHSAGSIVICHLLEASHQLFPKSLTYNHVFFLAPACRVDLFLEKGKKAIEDGVFKKFKMFTMEKEKEKADQCVPYIYTYSLLYMVSGLFEGNEVDAKIMGLHEHFEAEGRYTHFEELQELKTFLSKHTIVLSDKDAQNPHETNRSNALKHGDFDDDVFENGVKNSTLDSILKSIS